MAVLLGEVFDQPAERFIELQRSFDLARARLVSRPDPGRSIRAQLYGSLPIPEMIKRGWLNADVRDVPAVEKALTQFFGVEAVTDIEIFPHAAKKTEVFTPVNAAQLAWIYRLKKIASDMLVAKVLPGLRAFSG